MDPDRAGSATADSNEEQILIEQSTAKGTDALVVIPADSRASSRRWRRANSAGILLIDVNTKIDTSGGLQDRDLIVLRIQCVPPPCPWRRSW